MSHEERAAIAEGRRLAARDIRAEAQRITKFSFINPPQDDAYDRAEVLEEAARIAEGRDETERKP